MTGKRAVAPWLGPWRAWYQLEAWRRRRRLQLRAEPLCAMCLFHGRVTVATIAEHIEPHGGDWNMFWTGKLQGLCFDCYNSDKRVIQRRGYGKAVDDDGWPRDPNHSANS